MNEPLRPDLCVIGAGSAGLSTAAIAASFGVNVVLVERGAMGGECLNVGCVPSKAVIAAARRAHEARGGAAFGLGWMEPRVDFERLRAHVRGVIAAIAPNDSAERFTGLGVTVIRGEARFTGAQRLEAAGSVVEARSFVVATGSRPAVPPIPGLEKVPYLTNETVFDLGQRPERLIVIGAGPVGIELSQAYCRLGVSVVVVGRLLAREDPEMAAVVERTLLAEGVELRLLAAIERVEERGGRLALTLKGERDGDVLTGSHLLVAAGRTPRTDGLGLDAAGVAVDPDGIRVDRGLRTTNRRIYAVGDCAGAGGGGLRFTHVSNYHAGLVIRRALFRLPARVDTGAIPRVTYTDPEIAAVGLGEDEARRKRLSFQILRWPVSENDRAQTERATSGHLKALVTSRGKILGCSIAAPGAGELIVPWSLAMAKGLKVQDLAGLVFPYPTLSEISKRAAVEFIKPGAQNPWVRRAIRVARWLG